LDEEHALDDGQTADGDGDAPPLEEDAGQQIEARSHQHARDHARQPPRERVRTDIDRGGGAGAIQHEQLLAVVGLVLGLGVHGHSHGFETSRERGIRIDRVGMRLDDVDGPTGVSRRPAEDVDLLAGGVVGDP
jgi:hypothetical protein